MINDLHLETHSFFGFRPGPNVLILGRVHGNEYSGTLATKAIIEAIRSGKYPLVSGSVTFIPITNPLAARRDTRNGDRNLNRAFYQKLTEPQSFEDELNKIDQLTNQKKYKEALVICDKLLAIDPNELILLHRHDFLTRISK